MKNFKLYGYIGRKRVLVTNSQELSNAGTFDEQANFSENQQISFSCKIAKRINNTLEINPFYSLFYPEAKLTLELYEWGSNNPIINEEGNTIVETETLVSSNDLIIKTCDPKFYSQNEILSVTAEDFASNRFAKRGVNLEFTSTGNIEELTSELLSETKVNPNYKNIAKNLFSQYNIISTDNCEWTQKGLKFDAATFSFTVNTDGITEVSNFNFGFFLPQDVAEYKVKIECLNKLDKVIAIYPSDDLDAPA